MPDTIYTLGYQKRTIDEFVALAREADVDVLIDVREKAWSHKPGFSKSAFEAALEAAGIEYIHAPFAGNPKWIREHAGTHAEVLSWYEWYLSEFGEVVDAFEDLVAQVLAEGKRLALTCFERHSGDCHRSILAARWAEREVGARRITHLATEGCPRMIAN